VTCDQPLIAEERLSVSKDFIKKVSEIGTITVTFRIGKDVRNMEGHQVNLLRVEELGVVPEKAMKGDEKSHRARSVVMNIRLIYNIANLPVVLHQLKL
jgi:hypothetical protein